MPTPETTTVDLAITDSTPSGLAAAIAASRLGLRCLIITEDHHIGGMQTAGLGNTNAGQRATVGGIAREFHDRIADAYRQRYGAESKQVADCSDGFHFEPSVAEQVYEAWIAEEGIDVWREAQVVDVARSGERIEAVELADKRRVAAATFIDASYEGDLIALAGCETHIGRESSERYGEELAGIRFPETERGRADNAVQAYDYRLCLTDCPENRIPFREPRDYDPALYEDYRQRFQRRRPELPAQALPLNMMPNGKTDSRSGEWARASWEFPEATPEERRRISRDHKRYTEGWLWFLLTDPVVPTGIRDALQTWGYASDEFTDNDHWPYHIYVREARRLIGDRVMTQADILDRRIQPDSIGLGSFYLDVHAVRTVRDPDEPGRLVHEGSLGMQPVRAYEIPYRVLLPRRAEAINLWSTIAVSASHVAFSSLRMEPVFMMMGHAAGVAAALALDAKCAAQAVDVPALQADLMKQGQIISAEPYSDWWPGPPVPA